MLCNEKVNLSVQSNSVSFIVKNVLVVRDLSLSKQCVDKDLVDFCAVKTEIKISPYNAAPEMIIEQDNCNLILTCEYRELEKSNLVISRSLLGWSIHG
ncbi:hypothetical protein TSAR_004554, partial [Trichomalopsis sarcophagae]